MIERKETDLHLLRSRDPIPTVEIDLDSLPESLFGYADTVVAALRGKALAAEALRATLYVYQGASVNFGTYSWSAFIGVDGPTALLNPLLHAFQAMPGVRARFSDYIKPSQGLCEFHIEDGKVWRPSDAVTWYADDDSGQGNTATGTPQALGSHEILDGNSNSALVDPVQHEESEKAAGGESPRRFRSARGDATVGTIRRSIEQVYGLPEGSVALCGPDGHPLRSDALISTLRRRWD